jgi:hypothetical protein
MLSVVEGWACVTWVRDRKSAVTRESSPLPF